MVDLTPVVEAVITVVAVVCTTFVVPYLKKKISAQNLEELEKWVAIAVKMAEQMAKSGIIDRDERKQAALDFLASRGYSLDDDRIEALLESVVNDLPAFGNTYVAEEAVVELKVTE